jgi:small ligand-binding sensory domain FIST
MRVRPGRHAPAEATAVAALGQHPAWEGALAEAMSRMPVLPGRERVDLIFLFASAEYADEFPELISSARAVAPARTLIGCSSQGVIATAREVEGEPALSLLSLSLPRAALHAVRLTQHHRDRCPRPEDWHRATGVGPRDASAWFLFADPFTVEAEALMTGLSDAYPGAPIVGGLASGDFRLRRTHVWLDDDVWDDGAVALALGGEYEIRTIVSQGCTPIGEPWTITGARGQVVETIAGRPAYQVLVETIHALPPAMQQRIRGNLFVGLAMDEHRDPLRRGDFLIRTLQGGDSESGTLMVGAMPRMGQTIQFQVRDRRAADQDLRELLQSAKSDLGGREPIGALLCSCNGRGVGLFGLTDHDARAVTDHLGPTPLAGFFCNGEFGPVGSRNFLHGYTASIALVLRK